MCRMHSINKWYPFGVLLVLRSISFDCFSDVESASSKANCKAVPWLERSLFGQGGVSMAVEINNSSVLSLSKVCIMHQSHGD